jgi:hypothetical protein
MTAPTPDQMVNLIHASVRLGEAAPKLLAVATNFEITGPDGDGLVWLTLHGKGTADTATINLGSKRCAPAKLALRLEADRSAAVAKATSSAPGSPVATSLSNAEGMVP